MTADAPPIDAPRTDAVSGITDARQLPAGCDLGEENDQGNDDSSLFQLGRGTGSAEPTGLTFGTTTTTLCGDIDRGHFDATSGMVDTDSYVIAFAAEGDILIDLTGAGVAAIDDVEISLVDAQGTNFAGGSFVGDHGIMSGHVLAGTYELSLFAFSAADVAASIPYRFRIVADVPATRCPTITAAASYTEALDSAANNQAGNDMIELRYSGSPMTNLTASTTDAAEPTGLTILPATHYRVTGTAALPTGASPDSYLERDTYLFTTGAMTDQLSIRLDWPGTTADFDYVVFPEITDPMATPVEFEESTNSEGGGGEFQTFSVLPNTRYWLWIAPYNTTPGTSSLALPITYDASICGESFSP